MTRFSFYINYIYINYTPSCCEVHIGTRTLLLKIFNIGSWGPEMDHPRRDKFEKNFHHKLHVF